MKSNIAGTDSSVELVDTMVGQVHNEAEKDKLIGVTWGAVFSRSRREGWLTSHP